MKFLRIAAAITLLAAAQQSAVAQTNLTASGDWLTGSWSSGVPTATSDAILNTNVVGTVGTGDGVAGSVTLNFGSVLSVSSGRTLTISNSISAGSQTGTSSVALNGAGNIVVNGTTGTSTFNLGSGTGQGLLGGGGLTVGGTSIFSSPTTLIVQRNVTTSGTAAVTGFSGAGALQQTGVTWTNTGTMNRDAVVVWQLNNSTITNSGTWNNTGNGFTSAGGGSATFNNSGELNINASTTFSNVALTNGVGGTINVAANQSFTVSGGSFNGDGGTINVGSGASVNTGSSIVANGATVMGTGTVANGLTLSGNSFLTGGESAAGTLTINGNLAANDTTTLTVELGAMSGTTITGGSLNVTGTATFAGTTNFVVNTSGFDADSLAIGQEFTFLTAGSAIADGIFGTTATSGLFEFDVLYNQGGGNNAVLRLTAVPEPSSLAVLGLVAVGGFMRRRRS